MVNSTAGALILHGFTSTTASMQPVADAVRQAGYEVEMPLLPGHGTRWEELALTRADDLFAEVDAAYGRLASRCQTVVPIGMSMGGALALWAAATWGSAGVAAINPGLRLTPGLGLIARLLATVRPSVASIAGDIANPEVTEEAYERTPVRAVAELNEVFRRTRAVLPYLECPVLLLRSARDNVVGSASAQLLTRSVPKDQIQEVILRRSQHVATLDYDAELLQRRIIRFMGEVSASPAG